VKTRLYRVVEQESDTMDRLVDATSKAAAIRHVVGDRFDAIVATPMEVANLSTKGVRVEFASNDNA
jgi:hypothetical protein